MGKEYSDLDSLESQENSKMLIISILGIAILFVADLYVMINNPGNFVVFSIITILMMVWIFIFTRQMVKFQQQKRKKETEQFEELFRGQKANYLQQKKVSEQIAEVKTLLQHASVEDIVTAQKALAKVTISRSRENAEALMNSNDEVRQKMNQLLEDVSAVSEKMSEQQKAMIDEHIKGMLEREEQILGRLQEIDQSVKTEIKEAVEKLQTVAVTPAAEPMMTAEKSDFMAVEEPEPELEMEAVEEPVLEPEVAEEPETVEESEPVVEPEAVEKLDMTEEPLPELDFGLDFGSDLSGESEVTEATSEETATEEPTLDFGLDGLDFGSDLLGEPEVTEATSEETATEEPTLDFGLDGLDFGSDLLDEPEVTEATPEETATEEPALDFGLDLGNDLLEESESTEEPVDVVSEESVSEEPPILEDKVDVETLPPLDSNQIMEEEARLDSILADIQGMEMTDIEEPVVEEDAVEEPVTEEVQPVEPEVEELIPEEPVVEEVIPEEAVPVEPAVEEVIPEEAVAEEPAPAKAPAPENPNKIMTPDEIAALIANL